MDQRKLGEHSTTCKYTRDIKPHMYLAEESEPNLWAKPSTNRLSGRHGDKQDGSKEPPRSLHPLWAGQQHVSDRTEAGQAHTEYSPSLTLYTPVRPPKSQVVCLYLATLNNFSSFHHVNYMAFYISGEWFISLCLALVLEQPENGQSVLSALRESSHPQAVSLALSLSFWPGHLSDMLFHMSLSPCPPLSLSHLFYILLERRRPELHAEFQMCTDILWVSVPFSTVICIFTAVEPMLLCPVSVPKVSPFSSDGQHSMSDMKLVLFVLSWISLCVCLHWISPASHWHLSSLSVTLAGSPPHPLHLALAAVISKLCKIPC